MVACRAAITFGRLFFFSARDLQLEKGVQWMVGKTLDGFAPIGPYFVSADLVDPNNLTIETFVNDEK